MPTQLLKSDNRPTDLEYALMSQQVYLGEKLEIDDELPGYPGWKIYSTYTGLSDYFGVIYANTQTKQLVVTHKGTNSIGTLIEDLRGIVLNSDSPHKRAAFELTHQAIALVQSGCFKDYRLSFTGHSLGAFLAELCVFYCPRNFNYHDHVNAVTFDSPGIKEALKKLESNLENIHVDLLDILGYVSYPNLVDTFDQHVGTLYSLQTDLGNWGNWSGWFTKCAHTIDGFVYYLKDRKNEKLAYLTDWPMGNQRNIFFKYAKFRTSSDNDDIRHIYMIDDSNEQKEATKEQFTLDFKGHHHIDKDLSNRQCLPLRHFSPAMQLFLKTFYACLLNIKEKSNYRDQLIEQWKQAKIPANITAFLLGGYQIQSRKSGLEIVQLNLSQLPTLNETDIATFRSELSTWLQQSGKSIPELLGAIRPPEQLLKIVASVIATGATLEEGAKINDNEINILNAYLQDSSEDSVKAVTTILKQWQQSVSSITAYIIPPGIHVPKNMEISGNKANIGNINLGITQQPSFTVPKGIAAVIGKQREQESQHPIGSIPGNQHQQVQSSTSTLSSSSNNNNYVPK